MNNEMGLRRRSEAVLAKPYPRMLREQAATLRDGCPWFFVDGHGARLTTQDGRSMLDLEMGRGPNLLGYRHPALEDARRHGVAIPNASLLSEVQIEVAERLVRLFPCAETVVFGKNGSDACTAAIRTARALTGRSIVLSSGFHGFHDWCAADYEWVTAGLPDAYRGLVKNVDLNDIEGLARLADEHAADVAAVMIEPAHYLLPDEAFLQACRSIADKLGAVLIFDEVVTAFRLHPSGAQGLYGVVPDLACLGKAMANGEAISAMVGRADIIAGLQRTYFSMTFQCDNTVFAIARHCLDLLQDGAATASVQRNGEALRRAFDTAAEQCGLPHRALGFPGRLDFRFQDAGALSAAAQEQVFGASLLRHNVLPTRAAFACAMMTADDLEQAAQAFDAGMAAIANAL
jgi:glutamate-1-semialdehyde aminotransferase